MTNEQRERRDRDRLLEARLIYLVENNPGWIPDFRWHGDEYADQRRMFKFDDAMCIRLDDEVVLYVADCFVLGLGCVNRELFVGASINGGKVTSIGVLDAGWWFAEPLLRAVQSRYAREKAADEREVEIRRAAEESRHRAAVVNALDRRAAP